MDIYIPEIPHAREDCPRNVCIPESPERKGDGAFSPEVEILDSPMLTFRRIDSERKIIYQTFGRDIPYREIKVSKS